MTQWREKKGRLALLRELLSTFHFASRAVCDPRVPAPSRSRRPGPSFQLGPRRLAAEHPAQPEQVGPRPLLKESHKQCNVNSPNCPRMSVSALKGKVSGRRHVIPLLLPHRLTHDAVSSEANISNCVTDRYIRLVLSTKVTDCRERISSHEEFEAQHSKSNDHHSLSDVGGSDRTRPLVGQRKEADGRFHYSSPQIFTRQPE